MGTALGEATGPGTHVPVPGRQWPRLHIEVPTGQGSAGSGWPSGCPCTEWMGEAVSGEEVLSEPGCPGWALSPWQPHQISGGRLVVRELSAPCSGANWSPVIKPPALPGSRASPRVPPVLSSQALGAAGLGVRLGGHWLSCMWAPEQQSRSWGQWSWAPPWRPDPEHRRGLRPLGRLGPRCLPEARKLNSIHDAVLFPT